MVRARVRVCVCEQLYRVVSPALFVHFTVIVTVSPASSYHALHWASLCPVSRSRGRRRERLGRGGLAAPSCRASSRGLSCSRFSRGDVGCGDSRSGNTEEHTKDEKTTTPP